jgi:6-phosphogluconolactonase
MSARHENGLAIEASRRARHGWRVANPPQATSLPHIRQVTPLRCRARNCDAMAIVRVPVTAALLATACFAQSDYLAFAGGYGPGIYALRFHAASGRLTRIGLAIETASPSFLIVHPNGRFLYAVNEGGRNDDTLSAFAIDPKTAKLTAINRVSAHGSSPCDLALDKTGRFLAVANYASGNVAVFPVLPDGRLRDAVAIDQHHGSSVNPARQQGPHPYSVLFSPDNRFLLSADLGLDKIFVYRFDAATGAISSNGPAPVPVAPGSGPRHLAFHPNGQTLFVINEMASNVAVFHYDPATGALDPFQIASTLPDNFLGTNVAAELAVNPIGTILYASNRGNDTLALFTIDPQRFMIAPMERVSSLGKAPRSFAFDPTGQFLIVANQDSDNLVVFHVHPRTGELRPTGPVVTGVPKPACIVFVR